MDASSPDASQVDMNFSWFLRSLSVALKTSSPRSTFGHIDWSSLGLKTAQNKWIDQIEGLQMKIFDWVDNIKDKMNTQVSNHEKDLMKAFEIYTIQMHERIQHYKAKAKEVKRQLHENVLAKQLQSEIESLKSQLMQTRQYSTSLKAKNKQFLNDILELKSEMKYMAQRNDVMRKKFHQANYLVDKVLSSPPGLQSPPRLTSPRRSRLSLPYSRSTGPSPEGDKTPRLSVPQQASTMPFQETRDMASPSAIFRTSSVKSVQLPAYTMPSIDMPSPPGFSRTSSVTGFPWQSSTLTSLVSREMPSPSSVLWTSSVTSVPQQASTLPQFETREMPSPRLFSRRSSLKSLKPSPPTYIPRKQYQRSELEEIFLQWVQEVRKDIEKRRGLHSPKQRSGFLPIDKRMILEKFVSEQKVVDELCNKIFPDLEI